MINRDTLMPGEVATVIIKQVKEYPKRIKNDLFEIKVTFGNDDEKRVNNCKLIVKRYKRHPNRAYYYCYAII